MDAASWLEIGQVVAVDAARRSVRVKPAVGCLSEFESRDRLWLRSGPETPLCARIAGMRKVRSVIQIEFTPGISRDVVETFGRARVMIPETHRTPKPDGLPALSEMMGLCAVQSDGTTLGVIIEVIETPAGGAVRLRMPDGRVAALPFLDIVFTGVDRSRRIVEVTDPDRFLVLDDACPDA